MFFYCKKKNNKDILNIPQFIQNKNVIQNIFFDVLNKILQNTKQHKNYYATYK